MHTLNAIIHEQLLTLFGAQTTELVRLDSSDANKLSCHCVWVVRKDGGPTYFRSVAHVKDFMRLCGLIACRRWPHWTVEASRRVYGILVMAVY